MRISSLLDFFAILDEYSPNKDKLGFKKNADGSYDVEKYGWKNLKIHDYRPAKTEKRKKDK